MPTLWGCAAVAVVAYGGDCVCVTRCAVSAFRRRGVTRVCLGAVAVVVVLSSVACSVVVVVVIRCAVTAGPLSPSRGPVIAASCGFSPGGSPVVHLTFCQDPP